MPKITILVEGYVRDNGQSVQSTVTLVQDEGKNIIADPGMTKDPNAIAVALQAQSLGPEDIDTVFITHHHPDHTRFMGLFPGAKVVDHWAIYDHDQWLDIEDGYQITPDVKVMHTPGHTSEDATLLVSNVTNVPDKNPCTVAICHLWWFEGKDDDPVAESMEQLGESRKKIQAIADFVVPGHGAVFAHKEDRWWPALLGGLLGVVRQNPGIRPRELNKLLGREHSANYRKKLIDRGLVTKRRDGAAVRYYAKTPL